MRNFFYFFIVSVLFFVTRTAAQAPEPIHIGIIPFNVIDFNAGTNSSLVEDQVAACFSDKTRFTLIDRGITEKLKAELELAKGKESLYAKTVAEQGHMYGAQYLITGKVGALAVSSTTQKTIYGTNSTTYHGILHITVQINSVETGRVIHTYPFAITSSEVNSSSNSDILENVLCKFKSEFRIQVRSLFATDISVVKIEKEENGAAQEVLINAGKETFEGAKEINCSSSFMNTNLGDLVRNRKIYLDVITIEEIGTSKREKKIGELKVESVEGDFTLCKVTKGDKDIKEYFDSKKSMVVKMKQ